MTPDVRDYVVARILALKAQRAKLEGAGHEGDYITRAKIEARITELELLLRRA